jgi:DNA-binding winged helix-turn-helix (wHTH) protein
MKIDFGPFTLDLDTRQLRRGSTEVHLTPKALDLLTTLVLARPNALSKAQLQERVWPDAFVEEANLSNLIAEIREATDDKARDPVFIRTAHGFGYAFCGDARDASESSVSASGLRPLVLLEWGTKRFPLAEGEHIIGRDADLGVTLEDATVSRRHARVIVRAEVTTCEDLGSKNGTFRGDERVTSPTELVDGDMLRIGSLLLTFRAHAQPMSTVTATASES